MESDYNLPRERSDEKSSIIRKKHTIIKKQGSTIHYFKNILELNYNLDAETYLTILNELSSSPIGIVTIHHFPQSICVCIFRNSLQKSTLQVFLMGNG